MGDSHGLIASAAVRPGQIFQIYYSRVKSTLVFKMIRVVRVERPGVDSRAYWESSNVSNFMFVNVVIEVTIDLGAVEVVGSYRKTCGEQ